MLLYHLDLKTTMFKIDYLKKWFVKLLTLGFDGVIVEIDNKLIFPSSPSFAAKDALTAKEWRELVAFAKSLGLVIYPLLQTLGHMEHVLIHGNHYTNIAEQPGKLYMLCPSKEATNDFIKGLILDLISIFDYPSRIHLGGDEVYSAMKSQKIIKCPICYKKDESELLCDYLSGLADFCVINGIQPEFWADGILAYPQSINKFPKKTRFVDWNYKRYDLDRDFIGAKFIKQSGYEVVIASGVRSSGDNYSLPRMITSIRNLRASELVSRDLNCDHFVTSWAVRYSHPDTTLPLLNAINNNDKYIAIDNLEDELISLLSTAAGDGFNGIDTPIEQLARYERPYYDKYLEILYERSLTKDGDLLIDQLNQRVQAGEILIPILKQKVKRVSCDIDCLKHWIIGLEITILRSEEAVAIINFYRKGDNRVCFKEIIKRNIRLMNRFKRLWSESVTDTSLNEEVEIKFLRNVRILNNFLCE